MEFYIRNDISYCPGCGQFFDEETGKVVDIPYTDMPAEFAIQVMSDRVKQGWCHPRWRGHKLKKKGKGFGN